MANVKILIQQLEISPNGQGGYKWGGFDDIFSDTANYDVQEDGPLSATQLYELQLKEPIRRKGGSWGNNWWIYRNKLIQPDFNSLSSEELSLRIKHKVLKEEKLLEKIKKEVQSFENLGKRDSAKRERISEAVRLFVWQRDEGKCVKCGNKQKLEFDHIIPVAEGGSSTERNIQLLCETCNRTKGKSI